MHLKAALGLCALAWACSPGTQQHASSSGGTARMPCDVVEGAALAAPVVFIQRDDQANHPGVPAWFRVVDEHGGLGPRVDVPGALQDPLMFFPRRHLLVLKMRDTLEVWDTQAGMKKDSRPVAGSFAVSPGARHVLSVDENDLLTMMHLGEDGLFTTDVIVRPLARRITMPDQWLDNHTCVLREWDRATSLTTSVVKLDVANGDWETLWTQDGDLQVDRVFFHAASGTLLLTGGPAFASRAVRVPGGETVATQGAPFFLLNDGSVDEVGIWQPTGEVALWAPWQHLTPVPIPGSAGAYPSGMSRDHVWLMPYPTPDGPFVVTQRGLSGEVTGSWEIPLEDATQQVLDMHPTVAVAVGYVHSSGVVRANVSVGISDYGFSLGDVVLGNHGCVFQAHAAQFIYTRGEAFMAAPSLIGSDHASLMTLLPDGNVGHVADFSANDLGMMLSPEAE